MLGAARNKAPRAPHDQYPKWAFFFVASLGEPEYGVAGAPHLPGAGFNALVALSPISMVSMSWT